LFGNDRRLDKAGADGVAGDVVARQFQCDRLRKADDAMFRRDIGGLERTEATRPWAEAMLMIRPRPCAFMIGIAALAWRKRPTSG
jgi:hypothetical protein